MRRHQFSRLVDSQISHDFLTSTINTRKFKGFLEFFNQASHAFTSDGSAPKNLTCLISDKLTISSGLIFQEGYWTSQF